MMSRILPAAALVLALGLFLGYVNPTYTGAISDLRIEIGNLDRALTAAANYRFRENELAEARNRIRAEDLARLTAFLPDGVDNVQLILDLDALAARSGIRLSGFDIGERNLPASGSGYTVVLGTEGPTESLKLSVTAVGSYEGFNSFLAAAERSLRPLDLVELTIKDSPTGAYSFDMAFRIYWLR